MTIFHSEGTTFTAPTSTSFVPSRTPASPMEAIIPVALSTPASLWIPLDEAVYDWTTFVTLSMHNAALVAAGTALLALSWEQSALRHYTKAYHALSGAKTAADTQHVSLLLTHTRNALTEATDRWQRVIVWLDRYAQSYDNPPDTEMLETIRERYQQVTDFQHRLWTLAGLIRQEQQALDHPLIQSTSTEGGTN